MDSEKSLHSPPVQIKYHVFQFTTRGDQTIM